jgi:hypothetical protein
LAEGAGIAVRPGLLEKRAGEPGDPFAAFEGGGMRDAEFARCIAKLTSVEKKEEQLLLGGF